MALFPDGPIATLSDLKTYDSSVLDVASSEGVDVTAKLGLAQKEIGLELVAFLMRQGVALGPGHRLDKVLVTDPLLHWHCLHTLELIYRDAYNSQLNDRYQGKWREYAHLSRRSMDLLLDIGVGLSNDPMPQSAPPIVTTFAGGALPAAMVYISTAWLTLSGSTGKWSAPMAFAVPAENLLRAQPTSMPAHASGWCVYAGLSETEMRRQNELPLGPLAAWEQSAVGLRSDLANLPEQSPDLYVKNRRDLLRG